MSPLAGPLGSSTSGQISHHNRLPGLQLPMKDLRPSGRRFPLPPSLELSQRDLEALAVAACFRIVSGAQLRELLWPEGSPETRARLARRGLARLVKLEVLSPLARRIGGVRGGSAGTTYSLGRTGQRLLAGFTNQRVRAVYTPGERHLAHTLAVAGLYVDLVAMHRQGVTELLAFDPEPACWRTYESAYGARETLKPDAYAKLGIGAYEHSWFIEADLASEAPATIATKARRYLDCFHTGTVQRAEGVFPRTAWIAPDRERANIIAEALDRLPTEARPLFSVTTFQSATTLLSAGGAS